MDKSAIRNFAVWARINLIESVSQKAYEYGIVKGGEYQSNQTTVSGKILSQAEIKARNQLVARIKEIGYDEVMEEVAYTWFNRFTALRFMEVNEYLPTKVRVFSDENGDFNPDILKEALTVEMDGLNRQKIIEYIEAQNNEELYKYLLISQCNALSDVLSPLFTKLEAYVELLIPNNLLRADSVLYKMVKEIPEDNWKEQVEIIGWLYQFYISVKKDEVFASKKTITKETLPAVTQLFTPDWIVRYMAENSVGRIWMESNPNSSLKAEMKYYVDDAEQEKDVQNRLKEIQYKNVNPETIKVIEPCCGSGHILIRVFDLLYKMYEEFGYNRREIPTLILKNNIVGLDVDKRAAQLSAFSLTMKARSCNSRFFSENYYTKPQVYEIVDSHALYGESYQNAIFSLFSTSAKQDIDYLISVFRHGKTIGSLLKVKPIDFARLEGEIYKLENTITDLLHTEFVNAGLPVLKKLVMQAKILSAQYDVMITNPPYIGISSMEAPVKEYAISAYPNSKTDMFAMFMETGFVKKNGFTAMINMHSWMFLSSYEKLREVLLNTQEIVTMAHLGARAFEEIGGEVVQTTTFVLRNTIEKTYKGTYSRLIAPTTQDGKEELFLSGNNRYYSLQSNFSKIPGAPIAYWIGENVAKLFLGQRVDDLADARSGMSTTDNDRFLRIWHEINLKDISFFSTSLDEAKCSKLKWFPYNKGGEFRRWYGNNSLMVNWFNDGEEIKYWVTHNPKDPKTTSWGRRIFATDKFFKKGITWSSITTGLFSCRTYGVGFIFDSGANGLFVNDDRMYDYAAGYLNSKVFDYILKILNPTINNGPGTVGRIPMIECGDIQTQIEDMVKMNVSNSKVDWDSYETSWDFKKHPLI